MSDRRTGAILIALLLTSSAAVIGSTAGVAESPAPNADSPWDAVQHVVIVMMENRAYDNYFGEYCLALSSICPYTAAGLPPGICMPWYPNNLSRGCVPPFNLTKLVSADLPHAWDSSHRAYNNGSMNGFIPAESPGLQHLQSTTMGHYNGSLLPVYWDMAEEFGLGDNFFSSTLDYSLPNHWYLIAGTSPFHQPIKGGIPGHHAYLNAANNTSTVEQELGSNGSVSWKYFDAVLANYSTAIIPGGGAYNPWNPLAAKHQSYTQSFPSHFAPRAQFFSDAARGALPNVSWVIPSWGFSDHAPVNLSAGENFVASVVNAVGASTDWKSTAIFVSWDDYGGWYDHVAPPKLDAYGDGFRAPLLVISPWTPAGFVGHDQLQFESLLRLIEWHWGLGCLTTRDCNAPLPTEFFNFSLNRSPVLFGSASSSVYPYHLPPRGAAPSFEQISDLGAADPVGFNLTEID